MAMSCRRRESGIFNFPKKSNSSIVSSLTGETCMDFPETVNPLNLPRSVPADDQGRIQDFGKEGPTMKDLK